MDNNIFIPRDLVVGYRTMTPQSTSKLAYVIYYDQKKKLRKEQSWEYWRDNTIPLTDLKNIPTKGFVLKKYVGRTKDYNFNGREIKCRIFDPRGFEFEITVANLIYILYFCDCYKLNGFEGEFVYGWQGIELVLIPLLAPDYIKLKEYNDLLYNPEKITSKSLIPGATYLLKDNKTMIYLGHHNEYGCCSRDMGKDLGKRYWYNVISLDKLITNHYTITTKSLNGKIIKLLDPKQHKNYPSLIDKLDHDPMFSPVDESKCVYISLTLADFITKCTPFRPRYQTLGLWGTINGIRLKIEVDEWHDTGWVGKAPPVRPIKTYDVSDIHYTELLTDKTLEELFRLIQPCVKIEYLTNGKLKMD